MPRKRRQVCTFYRDDEFLDTVPSYAHLLVGYEEDEMEELLKQTKRALEHAPRFHASVKKNRAGCCSFAHLLEIAPGVKQEPLPCFESDSELEDFRPKLKWEESESDTGMVDEEFLPVENVRLLFKEQLERELAEPFDDDQLQDMLKEAAKRKAVLRHFETRQRVGSVQIRSKAASYLDQYPDLALKLRKASKEEQLQLLRGFFFWIQHACNPGAFKPWASVSLSPGQDCCEVVEGPEFKSLQEHEPSLKW